MAHNQNTADQRIDEVEYQGQFHLFLADDRCERIGHRFTVLLAEKPRVCKPSVLRISTAQLSAQFS
jgi:hypothetical protein